MSKSKNNYQNLNPIPFSSGKKTIVVISSYLGVALLLSLFFLPVFGTVETEELGDEKFYISASCSIFQILTQDTVSDIKVYGGTEEENEILSAFAGSANVVENSLFTEDWGMIAYYIFAGGMAIILVSVAPILFGKPKRSPYTSDKDYESAALSAETEKAFDRLYGTTIPKIVGMFLFQAVFFFGIITIVGFVLSADGSFNFSFRKNIDIIRLVIALVVAIFGISLASGSAFAKKEYNAITQGNFIYDRAQQILRPRTTEEMIALYKNAFGSYYAQSQFARELEGELTESIDLSPNDAANQADTTAKDPVYSGMNEHESIQLLKSYKELLDSGIISQEEFDQKKQDLLNNKKDSN